jgi:acyl carrier protein
MTVTPPEVQSTLHDYIVQQFPVAANKRIEPQTSLIHNGIIDSLGVLEIVTFIEQRFGVVMSDEELVSEHFDSIHSLSQLIVSKLPRDA